MTDADSPRRRTGIRTRIVVGAILLAAIAAGTIHSSVIQDSYHAGYETVEVLANEVRGIARGPAEFSPDLYVGINVLTNKNLALLRNSGEIPQPSSAASTMPVAPSKR